MTASSIHIAGVEAEYGSVKVLKGIDLDVEPGSFVALLGSSGCGKTTLLRCVSGLMKTSAGQIKVGDQDITDMPPEQRGMAMVFQSYALWPHMTVAQNIGYGLRLRRKNRQEIATKVEEMLHFLGLEGLGARKVTDLSGGQRQRVALGRALAIEPGILLLDEPLSNLDAKIRLSMRHEIRAIQQRLGLTAIHVTHDREEAMVMADRIIIMKDGEIVQDGEPEFVYRHPKTPFIAAFLGADNAIEVRAERAGETITITAPDGLDLGSISEIGCRHLDERVSALLADQGRPLTARFRAEAARLTLPGEDAGPGLSFAGQIIDVAYPGGRYRYGVATKFGNYQVDQENRFTVGDAVTVTVPEPDIHLFDESSALN